MPQFCILASQRAEILLQAAPVKDTPSQPQPLRCVQCGGVLNQDFKGTIPLHPECTQLHFWLNQ